MERMFEAFVQIQQILEGLSAEELQPIACMVIDIAAGKNGKRGDEWLSEVMPVICAVNKNMGALV